MTAARTEIIQHCAAFGTILCNFSSKIETGKFETIQEKPFLLKRIRRTHSRGLTGFAIFFIYFLQDFP